MVTAPSLVLFKNFRNFSIEIIPNTRPLTFAFMKALFKSEITLVYLTNHYKKTKTYFRKC